MPPPHRPLSPPGDAVRLDPEPGDRRPAPHDRAGPVAWLGAVAHEMRSPLSTLLMNLELLQQDRSSPVPAAVQSRLDRLLRAARELGLLVDGLTEAARLAQGPAPRGEDVDLGRVAAEVVKDAQALAPPGRAVQLRVEEHDASGLRGVRCDEKLLKVAVSNLVFEVLKGSTGAGVLVWVHGPQQGQVDLDVCPSSVGNALEAHEAHEPVIADAPDAPDAADARAGAGLQVAQRLIGSIGGGIHRWSVPGHGDAFRVRLPVSAG